MGKYKYFKIKTIKNYNGDDWDVYDERKSLVDIMVYRGWPYALTPRDGIGGQFSFILTDEISKFIKTHSITESEQQLGLSNSIVAKFRRTLGIQNKFIYRNDQWLLEHRYEILNDSLRALKTNYGLTRNQVYQHKKWLDELLDLAKIKNNRTTQLYEQYELWFHENRVDMTGMSIQDISSNYNISLYIAKKTNDRLRKEAGSLTFSEQFQDNKQIKYQWLLDHQDQLLNQGKKVAELAKEFNRTDGQILRAKARLREILKMPKVTDQKQIWLLANQGILLDATLSKQQTAVKLDIELSQVYRKRGELKKLLAIPQHNDQIQAWRLCNQEVLLSLHLSIAEIAKKLDKSEQYIINNRMVLRRFLGVTKQDQAIAWVLAHQCDFATLSIDQLEKKYNLGRYVAKSYKKLLVGLTNKTKHI